MQLGPWDVQFVSAGSFRLDGGAMYGTVPKAVWNRVHPADADNQILMDPSACSSAAKWTARST